MTMLITSCVRQTPEILTEFLHGLDALHKPENTDYYFILDSLTEDSLEIFKEWSHGKPVEYEETSTELPYFTTEHTHFWDRALVTHVAEMKDCLLEKARGGGYDYLFFTDSDQVYHPDTLTHMIEQRKPIIGCISWAKWEPQEPEMPNAWYRHPYDFDGRLIELMEPTVHEVNGFGGCYLISKEALNTPISWKHTETHPEWGEDRHFAIRSERLGHKLYVDATYPYFHIYRSSDIPRLHEWIQSGHRKPMVEVQRGAVLIGICIGETGIHPDTSAWLARTLKHHPNWGMEISRAHPIDSNRNMIVRKFMLLPDAQKYEWLLFLDTDVVPPHNGADKLLASGKNIVGGVCPIMGIAGVPTWNISKEVTAGYVKAELTEVEGMGTGFMLIHRDVFTKIGKPAFRFRYDNWGTASICGEDYDFCEKAVKAGYKVYADLSVQCEHYKEIGLLQLNRRLAEILSEANNNERRPQKPVTDSPSGSSSNNR